MKLTAKVRRDGKFWFVSVPEIPGLITQGRTVAEVPDMVADQAAMRVGGRASDFEVEVELDMPGVARLLLDANRLSTEADELRAKAAEERREGARALKAEGATVRDIGALLHVSYQRAAQLVANSR
ncbi:type II toxin-antitoxin system HicB family antitoxin [Sinomonas sp. P47F7]|uniref:type II toxin-antitoxin system HicB family antitoxin n=1 Tax=Sinomonas sp. P47F7 TaxID=3410987 RepID=UPI003BF475FE